ncbi:hypothetical protein [Sphingomonas qomolangmaensis]|uniref:Uncharacterized protein n=1 Tax=Sphingomonas qomolangmaensis TaxID=2918765 RepID=A0ABY5LH05_9SPHN|nr:hypothetical protein [Sphingomonas qomolangmaensis]UUL84016.1 hypothetical protein NMP03_07465 [Sphingomonas qomolangmaensis]
MTISKLARRIAPILLGITCLGGCSAEPDTERGIPGPKSVEGAGQAQPPLGNRAAPAAVATPAPAAQARLAVEAEGLRWFLQPSGSARPLPFGRREDEVLASLERVRGPAVKGTNADCGAGPVQVASWPDGLSLLFQDGRFAGWSLGTRGVGGIATAAGIGPGSTRAELDAAYSATVSQTSLGSEFSAGELHGVLDGNSAGARITDMWAGVSCVAR